MGVFAFAVATPVIVHDCVVKDGKIYTVNGVEKTGYYSPREGIIRHKVSHIGCWKGSFLIYKIDASLHLSLIGFMLEAY